MSLAVLLDVAWWMGYQNPKLPDRLLTIQGESEMWVVLHKTTICNLLFFCVCEYYISNVLHKQLLDKIFMWFSKGVCVCVLLCIQRFCRMFYYVFLYQKKPILKLSNLCLFCSCLSSSIYHFTRASLCTLYWNYWTSMADASPWNSTLPDCINKDC